MGPSGRAIPTGSTLPTSAADTIAVQTGSYYENVIVEADEACAADGKEPIDILRFALQTETMTRVATGGAIASIAGAATVGFAAAESGGAVEAMRPVGKLAATGPVGIAVPKGRHGADAAGRGRDERDHRGRDLRGHPRSLGRGIGGHRARVDQPRNRKLR